MKIAIMQPYFFPYIGYFQLISAVDKFIIYDDVNFINKGWINRNNILINGKAGLISVPLNGASQNKLIKDIAPISEQKWRNALLKTIEQNYKKAPHFGAVFPKLKQVFNTDSATISHFNFIGIRTICEHIGITTTLISSSEPYANTELRGQNRILDICKKENAQFYINPVGGMELYDREMFGKVGISLNFIKSKLPNYKQFKFEFIPALSIIDVIMFCEPEYIKTSLLNAYEIL